MESTVKLFNRIQYSLDKNNICGFFLKPKQVKCFENLLNGHDVLAVLPTGFGKSLLYHLLPSLLPVKNKRNIVIVVCPLNSIIEDQIKVLTERGVSVDVLRCERKMDQHIEKLFPTTTKKDEAESGIPEQILNGEIDLLFSHPESLLSDQGRTILKSPIYQANVVACVIDEAHCVEMW